MAKSKRISRALAKASVTCLGLLCSFLLCSAQSAPADGLSKGIALTQQGKYQEAVTALRLLPQSPTSLYYQAYCYYQLRHEADAKKLFAYVVDNYPRSNEAKLALDFLKRIDPTYNSVSISSAPPAPTRDAPHTDRALELAKNSSPSASASLTSDVLPNDARIYFSTNHNGHMMVDTFVNGRPFKCMFDTGAPGLLFGKNHLRQMGILAPVGNPTTSVRGWAGVAVPAWTMNLKVKIGNVERTLPATVQEEFNLDPLIGYSFVEGYQYEIDHKASCMTLHKASNNQQTLNSLYDIPCKIVGTKPIVPLEVNGRKVNAFIDTGASMSIMNAEDAAALHLEIPADAPTVIGEGVGGTIAYKGVTVDLKLGPIVRKEFKVWIGGHAGTCTGQDFLSGWRFTIDEQKGYLRFFH